MSTIFGGGEGKGIGEATPLCVPRDVRHELLVRVLPAREGRVVLDEVPEEDRLPLRVALPNNFEGEVRGPRLPQLSNDLARSRQRRITPRIRFHHHSTIARVLQEQRIAQFWIGRAADPDHQLQGVI